MTGTIVAVGLTFVGLLWLAISARRRALRTLLLATGVEVPGTGRLVSRGTRRAPRVLVTYTDSEGQTRSVIKSVVSAGDAELVRRPIRVVFHPRRTTRDDYVLVGFGEQPRRWFRVSFAPASMSSQ